MTMTVYELIHKRGAHIKTVNEIIDVLNNNKISPFDAITILEWIKQKIIDDSNNKISPFDAITILEWIKQKIINDSNNSVQEE